ncbi:hypothetical protein FA95DRAFT_1559283 [Auriscalpium vulgare]|uniref:Uncharacterized protein n=1 Tax=Auriscalpium vulgare TaxID=40419 RepID=A0ACB8RTQ0_9AGAM|nr:hypothetical protein FA95DRAFT_1559283 [Auriscalpium vulgare]
MSKLPPALLYLTIYNPTLKPTAPIADDDEDAEEQAHILFYTARERAVSRDRMLRQIGLAKALINFADMLAPEDVCENVHSQSRRMVMLSPEPGFWMHACVELAKSPRQSPSSKGKKGKDKDKDKGKEPEPEVVYDYHDGSVQDEYLRSHLLRGYEQFKLLHGSFASVLGTLGQQALELQLERFFTVWAWRWDLEEDSDFGKHLGLSLHPLHRAIQDALDKFASQIPQPSEAAPFLLAPPHFVPSTFYTRSSLVSSLPLFILSRIPPPPQLTFAPPNAPQIYVPPHEDDTKPMVDRFANTTMTATRDAMEATGSAFVALGNSMDVRKWNWPGYLTFGKGARKSGPASPEKTERGLHDGDPETDAAYRAAESATELAHRFDGELHVRIDTESLHDAMSSIGVAPRSRAASFSDDLAARSAERFTPSPPPDGALPDASHLTPSADPSSSAAVDPDALPPSLSHSISSQPPSQPPSCSPPPPTFFTYPVFIAPREDPQRTARRQLLYLVREQLAVAFLAPVNAEHSDEDLASLHAAVAALLTDVQDLIAENKVNESLELYSATKILQPKDKHIIITENGTTLASPGFTSRSEHLYNGEQLITEMDALEVFSRTQGPQHWHIARRERACSVYMEISRKETSLTDVDNELAGVVRRFREL